MKFSHVANNVTLDKQKLIYKLFNICVDNKYLIIPVLLLNLHFHLLDDFFV
jgi:hypothetical protein